MWPDLFRLRQALLPSLERWDRAQLGDTIKFSFEKYENEFAGVEKAETAEVRSKLRDMENVYVNNLAALKYVQHNGEKVYEVGSYAYRPEGRFGKWQTHLTLFPHEDGTAVLAHRELSPIAGVANGIRHYLGSDDTHDPEAGVEKAQELLDLQSNASFDDISN